MLSLSVKDAFISHLKGQFSAFLDQLGYKEPFDYNSRIHVWADTDKFNYKEDAFVWGQKREKMPTIYNVTLDGVDICTFDDQMSKEKVMLEFWKGFLEAYKRPKDSPNKVFIDRSNYLRAYEDHVEKQKKKKEKIREQIKNKPTKTLLEKEAKKLALDVFDSPPHAS